jgi:hypothetical protein
MNTFITVTFSALLAAAPALAQEAAAPDTQQADQAAAVPQQRMMRATTLLDGKIFASKDGREGTDWSVGQPLAAVPSEWEEVGDIEDLAIGVDGRMIGLVAEVGGFLGLGENTVIVPMADLRAVRVSDELYYITRLSREELEALPEIDDDTWN